MSLYQYTLDSCRSFFVSLPVCMMCMCIVSRRPPSHGKTVLSPCDDRTGATGAIADATSRHSADNGTYGTTSIPGKKYQLWNLKVGAER